MPPDRFGVIALAPRGSLGDGTAPVNRAIRSFLSAYADTQKHNRPKRYGAVMVSER